MSIRITLLVIFFALYTSTAIAQFSCPANASEVLILGGGMAGIAAAATLAQQGITDFVILEALNRLGGRMRNAEIASNVNVNIGANWFHGVDRSAPMCHPLYELMVRCGGLEGVYTDYNSIIYYDESGNSLSEGDIDGRSMAFDNALGASSQFVENTPAGDISARSGLTQAGWTPTTPIDNWAEWNSFDFSYANIPDNTSLLRALGANDGTSTDFLASSGTPEDFLITDNRGTNYLVQCLASNFTINNTMTDPQIHLETTVTGIEYSDSCVCANAIENGGSVRYCGRSGIVTFSIGVLKAQASTLFSPPLPSTKMSALNLLDNAFYYIIYATFTNRFWDDSQQFIGHISTIRGYFPIIGTYIPASRGVNAVVMPVTGPVAYYLANQTDAQLITLVGELFRNIYGNIASDPTRVVSMRWGLNPFFLGSYSTALPGGNDGHAEMARPEGRMYFAGEGASIRYPSTMHGAYLSGIQTANDILGITPTTLLPCGAARLVGNAVLVFAIALFKILYY